MSPARLLQVLLLVVSASVGGAPDLHPMDASPPGDPGVQVSVPDTVPVPEGDPFLDEDAQRRLQESEALRSGMRELLAIYRRMDDVREIRLHLEDGILEVSGSVRTAEGRTGALELARGLPGVVWVDDRLRVEPDLRRRLAPAWDHTREKWVAFLRFLPSLVVGLLLVTGSVLLALFVARRSFPFDRISRNPFARGMMRQVVGAAIVLTGVLLALDLMAVTALVGAVLGAAGIMGIAVGFAFRDIVENYLAGVLLSVRQPFAPNDHLQLADQEGRVIRLTARETILMTLDGNHVRIPNAGVFKAVITNFTRNPRRRFTLRVGVAPEEELSRAVALGVETILAVPGVLAEPRVSGRVQELQDSSVELRFSGWVDQTAADFGKVRSEATRAVKEAFEREGVETPPPEYGVRILEGRAPVSGSPSPPEGEQPSAPRAREAEKPDVAPDTTIEDEIARELESSEEENLLDPPRPGPAGTAEA